MNKFECIGKCDKYNGRSYKIKREGGYQDLFWIDHWYKDNKEFAVSCTYCIPCKGEKMEITGNRSDIAKFIWKIRHNYNKKVEKRTFLELVEEHCKSLGSQYYDRYTALAKLLPANAMELAIKIVKEYGYNEQEEFSWDEILTMCSDIASKICNSQKGDDIVQIEVSNVMVEYFLGEYLKGSKFNLTDTMKDIVNECYYKQILDLCTEDYILEYFKRA